MNTALFVITHKDIAHDMLNIANNIINSDVSNFDYIEVPMDSDPELIQANASKKIAKLNTENGLLILTDIFGGTPANIATRIGKELNASLVSGVNLPMLLKVLTHRTMSVEELTQAAIEGGTQGIQSK